MTEMTEMTARLPPTVDVRRRDERFKTRLSWLDSKHSFSFSRHYDPLNTHHGLLLVNNDDIVSPGTGFETHPHQDMEIVTWVLQGSLVHQDSTGHAGIIYPGLAQRMSAGTGILHSEKNDSWRLRAARRGTPIRCTSCRCGSCRMRTASPPATSSSKSTTSCFAAAWCRSRPAWTSTMAPRPSGSRTNTPRCMPPAWSVGDTVELPEAQFLHLFVPRGNVTLEGAGALAEGDAVRFTATGGQRVNATEPAEILVWEMHATVSAL